MVRRYRPAEDRFWEQVARGDPDECWPWTGAINTSGYGVIGVKKDGRWRFPQASRFSLELATGTKPPGMSALHTCDNRSCVNPNHLYWGTAWQNVQDMIERGRAYYVRGERHGRACLTEEDVVTIRSGNESFDDLAERFGVTSKHIKRIRQGLGWEGVGQTPQTSPSIVSRVDEMMTQKEVAALFKVDSKTVARWSDKGYLGFTRTLGGHRRYYADEVRRLFASQAKDKTTPSPSERQG